MVLQALHEPEHRSPRTALLAAHPPALAAVAELAAAGVRVSPQLALVLAACLAAGPGQRPPTAGRLLQFEWFTAGLASQVDGALAAGLPYQAPAQ